MKTIEKHDRSIAFGRDAEKKRKLLLERLQAANKMITEVVIEAAQDDTVGREVLLRSITALAHQQSIVIGIAAVAGIAEADVARAIRLAEKTAAGSLAHAQKKGGEGPPR